MEQASEARKQVERADILVLNKLDLVDDKGAAAKALVRTVNDIAPMLESVQSDVPWDMLLGDTLPRAKRVNASSSGHASSDHAHAHHDHDGDGRDDKAGR